MELGELPPVSPVFRPSLPGSKGCTTNSLWGRDQEPEAQGQGQAEHQSRAGTDNSHVIVFRARIIVGLLSQPQETKVWVLLLLYLEAKRPVDKVEIQVIQFQVCKSLLAGFLHQRLLVKGAPELGTEIRAHGEFPG